MMYRFNLSPFRYANVWLDDIPFAKVDASSTRESSVQPRIVTHLTRTKVVIEMVHHRGPKSSYALLGAEALQVKFSGLIMRVGVQSHGRRIESSLVLMPDEVRAGLAEEYTASVFEGVEELSATYGLPFGVLLTFDWAAHALVSSSPAFFKEVSSYVVRMLTLNASASEREIEAIFN